MAKQYETVWRNKFLCTECTTIEEMVGQLEWAAAYLLEMAKAGVRLAGDGVADDYAFLVTDDPKVAKRFKMEPSQEDD